MLQQSVHAILASMHAGKDKGKGKKKIMVLMSDTGGGHRASAEAIKSAFQIVYGNQFQVRCAAGDQTLMLRPQP